MFQMTKITDSTNEDRYLRTSYECHLLRSALRLACTVQQIASTQIHVQTVCTA